MKIKRKISFLLAFLLTVTLISPVLTEDSYAAEVTASGSCGTNATYQLYSDGTLYISGSGAMADYAAANSSPFYNIRSSIKKVVIKSGITRIGNQAFALCASNDTGAAITSVEMADTVTSVGDFAFYCQSKLSSVKFSKNLKSIGYVAFMQCAFTSVDLPDSLTTIDGSAFSEAKLSSVTIPDSVTSMGHGAFWYCTSLKSAKISSGLTSLDFSQFYGCSSLEVMYIPDSVTSFETSIQGATGTMFFGVSEDFYIWCYAGSYAASYAKKKNIPYVNPSLKDASLSLSDTSFAYDGTAKTPSVTVTYDGNTLTEGTDYTVSYANNTLPGTATVTVTGKRYTDSLTADFTITGISIEGATVTLDESIFGYDGSEKKPTPTVTLNGTVLTAGTDYTYTYKDNINVGTAYVVITGTGVYEGTLTYSFSIVAGNDSVYSQGDTLLSGNFIYTVLDDEGLEVEVAGLSKKTLTTVNIPATVTDENGITYKVVSIGQKAFYKNSKIKKVTIGNNVKSIESYAFYGCKNITEIKIGSSLELIGESSFRQCTSLKSITLPKSIDELGKKAFYGCKKLSTITINAKSVVDISDSAIKNISKKAVIKVPKKLVKKYKKELTKKTGFKSTMKIKAK